jgi:hypothetical protein
MAEKSKEICSIPVIGIWVTNFVIIIGIRGMFLK